MATQSKVESVDWKKLLTDLFIGTRKKQFISGAILIIIAFLIHIRNQNNGTESLKLKPGQKDKKRVLVLISIGWKGQC